MKTMKASHTVLYNQDDRKLQKAINLAMTDGWIPVGETVLALNDYPGGDSPPMLAQSLFREDGADNQESENTAMRFLRGVERRTRIWQILFWVVAVCFFWMVLIERL